MKNLFAFVITACICVTISTLNAQDTLTILHLNDTHSCLAPLGPRDENLQGKQGGIARAATIIGETRLSDSNVLVLHGGDVSIGDLFFNTFLGAAEFQMLKAAGVDVIAPGNHEFDLTPYYLDTALVNSYSPQDAIPMVCANLKLEDESLSDLKNYIKPYTIKQYGNIKVGIFGLLTPETTLLSQPSPAEVVEDFFTPAAEAILALKLQGCNVIVCLSHLGFRLDKILASTVPGIDVIISAHDHLVTLQPEVVENQGKTYIVQADAYYKYIGELKLKLTNNNVEFINYKLTALDSTIVENETMKEMVNGLITQVELKFGIPFYTSQCWYADSFYDEAADSLGFPGDHSTKVGKLVADTLREYGNTDVAITVGGATSLPLYQGPIVPADFYRMIGYGFNEANTLGYRITKFNINGLALYSAIEACLAMVTEASDEFYPQLSGLELTCDISRAAGSRILTLTINGEPIDPTKDYSVTTNEFIAYAIETMFGIAVSNKETDPEMTEFLVVYGDVLDVPGNKYHQMGVPENYRLNQNHPNPFNPETIISFFLPKQSGISLEVFSLTGEKAGTIYTGTLNAGEHQFIFNGSALSSGIYFYKLTAADADGNIYTSTKKMLLMK